MTDPAPFPSTRYQGSKRRLRPVLAEVFAGLAFDTALDAFAGTGAVAHLLKSMGKRVGANDLLLSSHLTQVALVENATVRLEADAAARLGEPVAGRRYETFVADTFEGIYFTAEENRWLDVAAQNAARLPGRAARALAFHALFQAALQKRPYNLFHRANLALRTRDVARSFGNKRTWERPFPELAARAAKEASRAVFDNGQDNRAFCADAADLPGHWDLVYLDPPYLSPAGRGTDYLGLYHFLEGLADYARWPLSVDRSTKHRRLKARPDPWRRVETAREAYEEIVARWPRSILVTSWRSDGRLGPDDLRAVLRRHGRAARLHEVPHHYALSRRRGVREVVLVSPPAAG